MSEKSSDDFEILETAAAEIERSKELRKRLCEEYGPNRRESTQYYLETCLKYLESQYSEWTTLVNVALFAFGTYFGSYEKTIRKTRYLLNILLSKNKIERSINPRDGYRIKRVNHETV